MRLNPQCLTEAFDLSAHLDRGQARTVYPGSLDAQQGLVDLCYLLTFSVIVCVCPVFLQQTAIPRFQNLRVTGSLSQLDHLKGKNPVGKFLVSNPVRPHRPARATCFGPHCPAYTSSPCLRRLVLAGRKMSGQDRVIPDAQILIDGVASKCKPQLYQSRRFNQ